MTTETDALEAAYRAQQRRRREAEAARERLLAGNPVARAALQARWQPLIDAERERRYGRREADPDQERPGWTQRV